MIKLRLKKYGRKGQPCYRIVAMDSRTKRDGRAIEELGFYNPMTDETHLNFTKIVNFHIRASYALVTPCRFSSKNNA